MTIKTPDTPSTQATWLSRSGAIVLTLVVSACAAPLHQTGELPKIPVPAGWSSSAAPAGAPASLANWWQCFNDPVLTQLVEQALQFNTDVRSARAALQQARALRDGKAAGLRPSVNASASAQRSQPGSSEPTSTFQAGFDASWEPDIFGTQLSAVGAVEADALASQSNLGQVQVSMAAEVAVTYMDLRGLQARLAIAQRNLAAQTETLQLARWRAQAGLASSLDVEQAVAASEQTAAQIPALASSLAQNQSSLAVLTGQAPGSLNTLLQGPANGSPAIPQAPDTLALTIPAKTLRQRPDVRTAEFRVQAALNRVNQADAARYPSFQISGSLGLRSLTLGALTDGASVLRSLLAGISVPLLDGGAARAQVQAQEAALEQTRVAYESAVLTALKDVEDVLVSLQSNQVRLTHLKTAAAAAANADRMASQRYASGLIDFRTVLDTQRTLLSTQDSVQATQANLSADYVRLYKALGGGWVPEFETATP